MRLDVARELAERLPRDCAGRELADGSTLYHAGVCLYAHRDTGENYELARAYANRMGLRRNNAEILRDDGQVLVMLTRDTIL
jgi:hypothetical protein